jgi:putative SOS response-associated peptidase YedK
VINSRDDKLISTKTYQKAFVSTRCLIPANGFYEWKTVQNKKYPYLFKTTDQEIYSFAGFYQYMPPATDYRLGCSIVTTKPYELVRTIHDRMPVILEQKKEEIWLDQGATERELLECLQPYPADRMESYQVSQKVNSVKNNTPDLVRPKTTLDNFFAR